MLIYSRMKGGGGELVSVVQEFLSLFQLLSFRLVL